MPGNLDRSPHRDSQTEATSVPKVGTFLIWIMVLAFLLRLAMLIPAIAHPERTLAPDTASYLDYARAMLHGQGWDYPSAHRTPGYPAFLALDMRLWGENIPLIVLSQVMISSLVVLLTYWLGKKLFGHVPGLLAAFLLALSTESITHSFFLLSETLFTCIFLMGILAIFLSRNKPGWIWPVAAGILMGAGTLTRPMNLYFPAIAAPLLLWSRFPLRSRLRNIGFFLAGAYLLLVPWTIRNATVVGVPSVTTISNYNLLYYNAASLEAANSQLNEAEVRASLRDRVETTLEEAGLPASEANQSKLEGELGRQIILSDPFGYIFIHIKSDLNSLLPDTDLLEVIGLTVGGKGTLDLLKQRGLLEAIRYYFGGNLAILWILAPSFLCLGATYLGGAVAGFRLFAERKFSSLIYLSLPVAYGLLLPGSPSNPRFRVPVMPFLCILAAYGLFFIWEKIRTRKGMPS